MFIVTKQIDSENISKLCRTCLREDEEKMVCLFVGPAGSSLAAKLRSLSCLEVWQGDGLPEKLCDRCVTRAESALLFREQCRAADRALRQAALKVSGITTYTTVSGCKLYQQNRGFTPIENSQKTLKCGECGAVFMDYQELYAHSRLHAPFIPETASLPHMHIVESQNTYFNADTSINESVIDNNHTTAMSDLRTNMLSDNLEKNDRPACALHCSLCNHTFPNRNQLINHNFSHCNGNVDISCDTDSIEIDDDSNEIAENLSFSRTIDLTYTRENPNHSMTIPRINYSNNLTLNTSTVSETNNITRCDVTTNNDDTSMCNVNNSIPQFSTFSNVGQKDETSNETENMMNRNNNFNKAQLNDRNSGCLYAQKKYECDKCGKFFSQKSKLIAHELFHTGEKPFKCGNCDKAYTSKSKLNAHVRLHTRTNVHQCDICKKTFSYPSYLLEHSKVHRAKSTNDVIDISLKTKIKFECLTCGKKFRLKKNLRSHMKFHIGSGLFNCEICDKSFSEKYNLKVHLRCHKGIKLHKCEYCDKSFNEKGNYTEHLRIHTKVKPFICKLCGKAFAQSSHLKSHETTHNSIRPHQCRLCGKRFKLSSHLKRHTNLHTAIKTFKCMQCNQMFSQAFSLKRHLKRHSEANI
ncbi:hypothetical protein PV326_005061 [Microctonus aethiopoides]|nr:hypothetical protein PV326_005061 [Microctonus aethiopoides]